MKILFVSEIYPSEDMSQYGIFLEQQAQGLIENSCEIDVLCPSHYVENKTINFHNINIRYYCCAKQSKLKRLLSIKLNRKDYENIEKIIDNTYDCISLHFCNLKITNAIIKICKKKGIKVVQHFHGLNIWGDYYDKHYLLTKYRNYQKKKIYNKLNGVVCVSKKTLEAYEKVKQKPKKYIVYNGVDVNKFYCIRQGFFNNNIIKILCVANLIKIKGQEILLNAVKPLIDKGFNIEVCFLGRGVEEESLKKQSKMLNIENNLKFMGYVKYDNVSEFMREYDLFILPSYFEAIGCVYLEAMASGMITVGVKTQGIDEVIENGRDGFLVEPKNVADLTKVIENIQQMTDRELLEMSKRAQKKAEQFTWIESAKQLKQVYDDLLKGD